MYIYKTNKIEKLYMLMVKKSVFLRRIAVILMAAFQYIFICEVMQF